MVVYSTISLWYYSSLWYGRLGKVHLNLCIWGENTLIRTKDIQEKASIHLQRDKEALFDASHHQEVNEVVVSGEIDTLVIKMHPKGKINK